MVCIVDCVGVMMVVLDVEGLMWEIDVVCDVVVVLGVCGEMMMMMLMVERVGSDDVGRIEVVFVGYEGMWYLCVNRFECGKFVVWYVVVYLCFVFV